MSTDNPAPLLAEVQVLLVNARQVADRLLEHMARHEFAVTRSEDGGAVAFHVGNAWLQASGSGLFIRATAAQEAGLAYVKSVMASHLIDFAEGGRPEIVWTGHGADATAFPNFREMTVTDVADITPHMRRIRLEGADLASFATGGLHFKLFVPPEGIAVPEWPVPGRDGLPIWPAEEKRPRVRTYTIRRIDAEAGWFDVDFVLHGDDGADQGVGARWAMKARPGDIVGARGPVGRAVPQVDWYLLAGDETALPVIARQLESLPASARGVALVEIAEEGERQRIEHQTGIELRWLVRNGVAPGTTTLLADAVRAVEVPADGTTIYAFAGVEAEAFKAIRQHWREVLKLDKKDVVVNTYWRRGLAEGE
jgi:NADPH-dependent ferric siderophore reductase